MAAPIIFRDLVLALLGAALGPEVVPPEEVEGIQLGRALLGDVAGIQLAREGAMPPVRSMQPRSRSSRALIHSSGRG